MPHRPGPCTACCLQAHLPLAKEVVEDIATLLNQLSLPYSDFVQYSGEVHKQAQR